MGISTVGDDGLWYYMWYNLRSLTSNVLSLPTILCPMTSGIQPILFDMVPLGVMPFLLSIHK